MYLLTSDTGGSIMESNSLKQCVLKLYHMQFDKDVHLFDISCDNHFCYELTPFVALLYDIFNGGKSYVKREGQIS